MVTLILYFGEQRWNRPHSLHDCLDIPEELKPFVSDYKVNVFEIAWLSDEQVKLFQSDFRYVADFFVQSRKSKKYDPPRDTVDHVHEVLQLMSALTKDRRFETAGNEFRKGENLSMCEILDEVENRGIQKGISKTVLLQKFVTDYITQKRSVYRSYPEVRECYSFSCNKIRICNRICNTKNRTFRGFFGSCYKVT